MTSLGGGGLAPILIGASFRYRQRGQLLGRGSKYFFVGLSVRALRIQPLSLGAK